MIKTYLITPGEFNGVGLEVTLKALASIPIKDVYIIYTKKDYLNQHLNSLSLTFSFKKLSKPSHDLPAGLYFIDSKASPADWFKNACSFCNLHQHTSALITGPLTKASFNDSKILGHTSYLRFFFKELPLFMTFFGEIYNCLLLNDHIPLKKVPQSISKKQIDLALKLIKNFNPSKVGLLGLNPHAGECGFIGDEELLIHSPIISKENNLYGPLSPDEFFSTESYKSYDFIIANYHDQGLIPFKLINGFNGSQTTLGLPFVRTSVNHGTGEVLHMKSRANPASMIHAIKLAQRLLAMKLFKEQP